MKKPVDISVSRLPLQFRGEAKPFTPIAQIPALEREVRDDSGIEAALELLPYQFRGRPPVTRPIPIPPEPVALDEWILIGHYIHEGDAISSFSVVADGGMSLIEGALGYRIETSVRDLASNTLGLLIASADAHSHSWWSTTHDSGSSTLRVFNETTNVRNSAWTSTTIYDPTVTAPLVPRRPMTSQASIVRYNASTGLVTSVPGRWLGTGRHNLADPFTDFTLETVNGPGIDDGCEIFLWAWVLQ